MALAVAGSTVVGWGGAAAGARYGIVDLGTLGGNSSAATAINDSGVVVGSARLPGSEVTHAFLYSGGRMRDLGTLPGKENSGAAAVNSAGDVAGTSWRNETTEAFRSGPGGFSPVRGPDPAVPLSTASGIDDRGDVVGSVVGTEPGEQPVGASSGPTGAHLLTPADGALPAGVSSAGDVVGSVTAGGASRAFVERGGVRTELGTLGPGGSSVASAVDDAGTVVGWSTSGSGGAARAFRYAGGRMVDLGLPRDTESEARALNDAGQIVGDFFDTGSGRSHAFLYDNGAAVDLNTLIDSGSGWILEQATGINDRGQIVGVGSHDGATRAFLLTPGSAARSVAASSPAPPPGRARAVPVRRPAAAEAAPSLQVVVENPNVSLQAVGPDGTAYGVPVGNDYEIMRSSDEGATWTRVYSFPSSASLWYISALSDGTLLASLDTGSWTIWRSTDRGSSWTQVLSLPSAPVFYRTLTPHSIAEGHGFVWLGTYNNGSATVTNYVYRSADDGRTWSVSNTTTTHRHIHGLGFNPADGKLYVFFGDGDGDGVWVSSDNGQTLSPLCTQYACTTIDAAFDPTGLFAIFGQDNYTSQNHIVRLDLATGALTIVRDLPYDSFTSVRVGGTYLVGTTHESGVPVVDPNLHLYASNDGGSSFTDVFQRALAYTTGSAGLQVQFAFPNGDVPIQIGGYGTIVGRLSGAGAVPVNVAPPTISGTARQGQVLTASPGTWTGNPTGYVYQWQRCDPGGASCVNVGGAGRSTYAVSGLDVGRTLRVVVTATNADGSAAATSAATPVVAAANALLVVVPHPDDEGLGFAGVIESAVTQGRPVYVAVVTNGDASLSGSENGYCGASSGTPATTAHYGLRRDGETVAAMGLLGLARTSDPASTRIFFLGYPDGGLQAIASSGTGWTGDATGLHRTYAEDGDGSNATCNGDLHYQLSGTHAQLSASGLNGDLDSLIALTQPTDVYLIAAFDGHPDHTALHQLVVDAVQRAGLSPALHSTLVHPTGSGSCMVQSAYMWPNPSDPIGANPYGRFTPTLDATAPPTPVCTPSPTGQSWGSAGPPNELVAVPADMRSTDPSTNMKWQVISRYSSQIDCTANPDGTYQVSCGYMRAFVKAHEFFWTESSAPSPPVNTGLPVIGGSVVVGQVLSASSGVWSGSPTSYAYEWRRCD
ncbi:MAG TPA: PIG-L family deacetylase, partial [Gaiellaceae bacterium]|nr:PIG-L family deacetylase [Gaiellaceae bacterium]